MLQTPRAQHHARQDNDGQGDFRHHQRAPDPVTLPGRRALARASNRLPTFAATSSNTSAATTISDRSKGRKIAWPPQGDFQTGSTATPTSRLVSAYSPARRCITALAPTCAWATLTP